MAILAGIDEAGLGPLLGPLVVTATAFRVPDDRLDDCLWKTLCTSCTTKPSRTERRLAVADSKALYRTRGARSGLGSLERTALVMLAACGKMPKSWRALLDAVSPGATQNLERYAWYNGRDMPLPFDPASGDIPTQANALVRDLADHDVSIHGIHSIPLDEAEFNRLIHATNNKSAVSLSLAIRIIDRLIRSAPRERIRVCADRLGGRTHYRDALMTSFPEHKVTVMAESQERSAYRLVDGETVRDIEFVTRGDQRHFAVALASVYSKYIRELYMHAFNEYWAEQVKGVRPTAGYYTDAKRWLSEMSDELDRRRIDRQLLVRSR